MADLIAPDWGSCNWDECFRDTEYDTEWRDAAPGGGAVDRRTPENVAEVLHDYIDDPDDYDNSTFHAVVRFTDGAFGALEAWNDSTGWGCQDGVTWSISFSYDDVIRWGLGDAGRRALGIAHPAGDRQEGDLA